MTKVRVEQRTKNGHVLTWTGELVAAPRDGDTVVIADEPIEVRRAMIGEHEITILADGILPVGQISGRLENGWRE